MVALLGAFVCDKRRLTYDVVVVVAGGGSILSWLALLIESRRCLCLGPLALLHQEIF